MVSCLRVLQSISATDASTHTKYRQMLLPRLRLGGLAHRSGALSAPLDHGNNKSSADIRLVQASFLGQQRVYTSFRQRRQGPSRGHDLEERRTGDRSVLAPAYRWNDDDIAEDAIGVSFSEGVRLFNAGDYYQCHDVLESLWNNALDPQRSILHGILQCAVGLYHLLHQNHRGAMVELGEGLTKLRRAGFGCGPLHDFEQEASAVLEFVYNTQLEYAACSDDICVTMDGSEQSYRLLGNFGAGQVLYRLAEETDGFHIEYLSQQSSAADLGFVSLPPLKVKVPLLQASEDDLYKLM